jgi:ketosteroid isomerase-like protein
MARRDSRRPPSEYRRRLTAEGVGHKGGRGPIGASLQGVSRFAACVGGTNGVLSSSASDRLSLETNSAVDLLLGARMMTPEALMKRVAAAFEKSDLQPLFDAIHEKVIWKSASTVEGFFRFGGAYSGQIGVKELTSRLATTYSFQRFAAKEIVSSGDIVWGLFHVEGNYHPRGRNPPSPKKVRFEVAIRWRVQDQKVVEHQTFLDTASLLVQQGEIRQPTVS